MVELHGSRSAGEPVGDSAGEFSGDSGGDADEVEASLASHPRRESLLVRERLVEGVHSGITSQHGLIAHGRGEAFDYLIGERTRDFAEVAIRAAVGAMLLAERPVISVNGNAAALVPGEMVRLSEATGAPLEVNIFHHSEARVDAIASHLGRFGGDGILRPSEEAVIETLSSGRRFVSPEGIAKADVVFVPLEDGDRCGALRAIGKTVVAVDLNPMSRTSRDASITIVDNVVRAVPRMIEEAIAIGDQVDEGALRRAVDEYDHASVLADAESALRSGL